MGGLLKERAVLPHVDASFVKYVYDYSSALLRSSGRACLYKAMEFLKLKRIHCGT